MSHHLYEDLRRNYISCYVAGDAAGLAQLYTGDCCSLPPDGPMAAGREGVEAFYAGQFAQMTPSSLTITAVDEADMGDWGYGAGSWAATVTLKATGTPLTLEGKYLNVVKRQADGSWKIYRHAWNAPTQLAAMAAGSS